MTAGLNEVWVWVPFQVDKKYENLRIDQFLARRLTAYSRSRVQRILSESRVIREGRPVRASSRVRSGETISIAYRRKPEEPLAENVQIPIAYEDEHLLLVNKPAGLLSHPTDRVLQHTVLGYIRKIRADLPKLHLLHRLDRETSGILALAKNPRAARKWTSQMEKRLIQKEYIAFVHGIPTSKEGLLNRPIGRQGGDIKVRQWVDVAGAVRAETRYEVIADCELRIANSISNASQSAISVVRCRPLTGRLHQIRVHLAAIGHPILGDPLYGGEGLVYKKMVAGTVTPADRASLGFPRLALHAAAIAFNHPITGEILRAEAPLPEEMRKFWSDGLG